MIEIESRGFGPGFGQPRDPSRRSCYHALQTADGAANYDTPGSVTGEDAHQLDRVLRTIEEHLEAVEAQSSSESDQWQRENLLERNGLLSDLVDLLKRNTGTTTGSSRRLTKDPEAFSGEEKDSAKRQQAYTNWRSQINRVFAVDRALFDIEFRTIQHISGLLTGGAYDIQRDAFDTVTESPDDPAQWHWATATEVLLRFSGLSTFCMRLWASPSRPAGTSTTSG